MTETPIGTDREPGVRCCIALPPEALDDHQLASVSADLELLAHPIRLRLLTTLAQLREPACVCDLEATVPVKQPTVSHHLKLLRSAGLVTAERRGPWTYYSVQAEALRAMRGRVAEGLEALTPEPEEAAGPGPENVNLKDEVRSRYALAARQAASGAASECGCGTDTAKQDPITSGLYEVGETGDLPEEAVLASLGCGNPTALASLAPGETVLDLGSGGGIDVLLSARRVGPTGKVYGLDMTDEMLELARKNQAKAGVRNAEFLKGDIEDVPLPDASVDVIISNCVINLATDKAKVLREAFRVLRPGGRFAVSDIVVRGDVPARVRRSMELWIGCVAGALEEAEYRRLLREAGFVEIDVEATRIYGREDTRALLESAGLQDEVFVDAAADRFMSAFVRGVKAG